MKLNKRLEAIASLIPSHKKIADIGTDHAYLPIFMVKHANCLAAIAGDINLGPFLVAREQVKKFNLQEQIDVRKGDGLQVIEPGEAEVIIIAGMGGETICKIMEEGLDRVNEAEMVVLQPNTAALEVRNWLIDHQYYMVEERLVEDGRHLYQIIVAQKGIQPLKDPLMLEIGPKLWSNRDPLLKKHLEKLIHKYEIIEMGLQNQQKIDTPGELQTIQEKILHLKEVYADVR